jgi:ribulose-5-phosphate 4-epimerase/fuculose-1-phosphate aldolase
MRTAEDLEARLAETGRLFYQRGWVLGTSGNFSAVMSRDPLRLLITRQSGQGLTHEG